MASIPSFVQDALQSLISELAEDAAALLPAPGLNTAPVAADIASLEMNAAALAGNPTTCAAAIAGLFSDYATAAIAALTAPPPTPADPNLEYSSNGAVGPTALPADPSFGLAAFCTWGRSLAMPPSLTPASAEIAANQAAFLALVRGSAVVALATLYAATPWQSAADAAAARDQIVGLIERLVEAAFDASRDGSAEALESLLAAAATDLTVRGKSLPNVMQYQVGAALPDSVLAYRLYQDSTRAFELDARNHARHPLFLPATGEALSY
jgi:hypothetical protein